MEVQYGVADRLQPRCSLGCQRGTEGGTRGAFQMQEGYRGADSGTGGVQAWGALGKLTDSIAVCSLWSAARASTRAAGTFPCCTMYSRRSAL